MINIVEGQELEVFSLLSFRGEVCQAEIPSIINRMNRFIAYNGASAVGMPISATFGARNDGNTVYSDTEILIPVDKKITNGDLYHFKKRLFITNAVKVEYCGTAQNFSDACNGLDMYISEKKYTPITVGYIVTKKVDNSGDNVIMDVYMGINPNEL